MTGHSSGQPRPKPTSQKYGARQVPAPSLQQLKTALKGEISGGQVIAPGPGHSPNDRSMAVRPVEGAPDGFLVKSHAGDSDLACKDFARELLGREAWRPSASGQSILDATPPKVARKPSAIETYIYENLDGPCLRVHRGRKRDGAKTFWQMHPDGRGGWEKGGASGPKVPYRLPELIGAKLERPVYICEGEKDADKLAKLGLVATTNAGGAEKWSADLDPWFKGRPCYVLADNDEPGERHALQVAGHLQGVAESVRIVRLPGLPPKGDVSDWLASGHDPSELTAFCAAAALFGAESVANDAGPAKRGVTAAELFGMVFAPVEWTVAGLVTEGLTVLAGKPKLGKSWLCLDFALAVARGGIALGGRQCSKGAVLYAALEDTKRRLRERLDKVNGSSSQDAWPENLTFWTFGEMKRLADGGLEELRAWIIDNPDAKLIMLDTFARVRSGRQGKENAYEADYREVVSLKALADETGVAIVLVMHTRKMEADDPFDTVSGTLGITGAADTTLILSRNGFGTTLHANGRDVAAVEAAVEFDPVLFAWRELGAASEVHRTDERKELLKALQGCLQPMTSRDLADATGQKDGNIRRMLGKMTKSGEVKRHKRGLYVHPLHCGNSGNEGHNDEDGG